jgi:hypothetical protein
MKTGVLVLVVTLMPFCALAAAQGGVIGAAVTGPDPSKPRTLRNLAPNPDEQLRVFYQGPDGALATTWAVGSWSAPASITPPGAGRPNSPIAATTNVEYGTFHAYYVGPDGAVVRAMQLSNHWRTEAITQPGLARGDSPLVVFRADDSRIWVLFFDPAGSLWMVIEKPRVGSIDRVTFNMLNPGNGTGLVGVGSYRRNEWRAFYQLTTGALVDLPGRTSTPHGGGLLSLGQLAPPGMARPQSPIAALTRDDGQIHVFFVRPDGAVATTWSAWSGGRQAWGAPFAITPPGAARGDSPLAAVEVGDQLHVFYVGPDGALATTWAAGPWQTPFPITRPGAGRPGTPIAVALRRDALHVFFIRPDNAVATTWSERGSHVWRPPIAITPPGAGSASASIAAVSRR